MIRGTSSNPMESFNGNTLRAHEKATRRVKRGDCAGSSAGEIPNLRLRTDNVPQYDGREFKKAMQAPGIRHEFIWRHMPEQNGHMESFHMALKKEYMLPHGFACF